MPQIKYADMHCDTLTACRDAGASLFKNGLQADMEKLDKSGCAAQCFAIFTQGASAALRFEKYLAFFNSETEKHGIKRILCAADIAECVAENKTGAALTVENLGFTRGEPAALKRLAAAGVKMASLVWNKENSLAYPNLRADGFTAREGRGLKDAGRKTVEALDAFKIIVDISHLSDGGAEEILKNRKIPVVASHSCAAAVCNASRNLTDALIKKISACGGVIGVNYCTKFLGAGATFNAALRHIRHIINVGGADAVALGSDFDGIPAPPDLENCAKVPSLLEFLYKKLGARVTQKLCLQNFTRVFGAVCG